MAAAPIEFRLASAPRTDGFFSSTGGISSDEPLTMLGAEAYIAPLGAPPLGAMARLRAPHCFRGDRASGHDRMAMSDVRASAAPALTGDGALLRVV